MANMGGISEQSEEDEEKELREAFKVSFASLSLAFHMDLFLQMLENRWACC